MISIHVLMLGCRDECVRALTTTGHTVSVLYENGHADAVRAVADVVTEAHPVESYRSVDAVFGTALMHGLDRNTDLVVTAHDFAVVTASTVGVSLGVRSLSPTVVAGCRDKLRQKKLWHTRGIRTARGLELDLGGGSAGIERQLDDVGMTFPVVLKPRDSAEAMSVSLAANAGEILDLAAHAQGLRAPLVEEFIEGPEWHFDGIATPHGPTAFTVSRYGEPLLCAKAAGRPLSSVTFDPVRDDEMYRQARHLTVRALEAVGLDCGAFHPGGGLISTINKYVTGVDLWRAHMWSYTSDSFSVPRAAPGRTFGYTRLPATAGETNQVTIAQLEALPGVVYADVRVPVGALMGEMRLTSAAGIGLAAVAADDESACWRQLREVCASVFRINSEAVR